MNTLWQDLRYSLRTIRRQRGFIVLVVVLLALGVGANTAIFSVVNTVLLQALPYQDPDRLVMVWEDASFAGFPRNTPAPANYADWKAQNKVFEDIAALDERSFNLTGDREPERVVGQAVSANFFPLLGVQPAIGRTFSAEEDQPERNKTVVLSYGLWQQRYGADRGIIGRDLLLDGEKYSVVGVMPAGFQFLGSYSKLWMPIAFTPNQLANRGAHYLSVVARMKPGVALAQANSDIHIIQQRIAQDHPDEAGRLSAFVIPLREELAGDIRRPLLMLLVAVGFVLLIACANIANLLLSRAAGRQREIAVRFALGASRWRVVRQLLTESVLLSVCGAALGILLAWWSFDFLQSLIPDGLVLSTALALDLRVLGYTLLVSLITGVMFGLAPAVHSSKSDLNEALKQSGARSGLSRGGNRLRSAMVVTEVALAMVLLVGAGLLIQTFWKLRAQYSGLQPEKVLVLRTQLPVPKYSDRPRRAAFYNQVLDRIESLPGVISAGFTTNVPLEFKGGTSGFYPEGRTVEEVVKQGLSFDATHRQVTVDYLKTMGIALRRGRGFTDADNEQTLPVAIVNETMARQYWPGEEAIGKRFKLGDPQDDVPWITVVGVAADVRQMGADQPVKAEMYFPYQQVKGYQFFAPRDLVVRTASNPLSLAQAIRREVHAVDPAQPVSNIRTMNAVLDEETASRQIGMTLLSIFAALALLLAGVALLASYIPARRATKVDPMVALRYE